MVWEDPMVSNTHPPLLFELVDGKLDIAIGNLQGTVLEQRLISRPANHVFTFTSDTLARRQAGHQLGGPRNLGNKWLTNGILYLPFY